jgi:LPXTG-motif cell wall-anchored protein
MIRRRSLQTLAATAAGMALLLVPVAGTGADGPAMPAALTHAPSLRPPAQIATSAPPLRPIQAQEEQAEEEERGQELTDEQKVKPPKTVPDDAVRRLEQVPPPRKAPFPAVRPRPPQRPLPRTGANGLFLLLAGLALTSSGFALRRAAA